MKGKGHHRCIMAKGGFVKAVQRFYTGLGSKLRHEK